MDNQTQYTYISTEDFINILIKDSDGPEDCILYVNNVSIAHSELNLARIFEEIGRCNDNSDELTLIFRECNFTDVVFTSPDAKSGNTDDSPLLQNHDFVLRFEGCHFGSVLLHKVVLPNQFAITLDYCNINTLRIFDCYVDKLNFRINQWQEDYSVKSMYATGGKIRRVYFNQAPSRTLPGLPFNATKGISFVNTHTEECRGCKDSYNVSFRGYYIQDDLPEGELFGYKAAFTYDSVEQVNALKSCVIVPCIVKLRIPSDAKRSRAFSQKCRCSKAEVVSIYDLNGIEVNKAVSVFNTSGMIISFLRKIRTPRELHFMICSSPYEITMDSLQNMATYTAGDIVEADSFDDCRWNECSHGIHFFINEEDAKNYITENLDSIEEQMQSTIGKYINYINAIDDNKEGEVE